MVVEVGLSGDGCGRRCDHVVDGLRGVAAVVNLDPVNEDGDCRDVRDAGEQSGLDVLGVAHEDRRDCWHVSM